MALEIDLEENGRTRRVRLDKLVTVIGRSGQCDLRLATDIVSSRHAAIKMYTDGAVVEDLGSANGTLINGQKISQPIACPNGTKIQLGGGGPTIWIVKGSSQLRSSGNTHPSKVHVVRPKSNLALWVLCGSGVAALLLFLTCGVFGASYFAMQYSSSGSRKTGSELNEAVSLIYCGWKTTGNNGQSEDQSSLLNILAIDGIYVSDELKQYRDQFVESDQITEVVSSGKKVACEFLLGSSGTGFPITADGYILTNKHVVEEAAMLASAKDKVAAVCKLQKLSKATPTIWAFVDGEPHLTELVFISDRFDMAIIKSSQPTPDFFSLSLSGTVQRGTEVSAIGFPGAVRDLSEGVTNLLGQQSQTLGASGTVKGFIAATDLDFYQTYGKVSSQSKLASVDVVYHGAKINHGNSGGPLVDSRGIVVGINTWGDDSADVNGSQLVGQMRDEIDSHVPGVHWVK